MLKDVIALCNNATEGHTLHLEFAYKSLVLHGLWLLFYTVLVSPDTLTC